MSHRSLTALAAGALLVVAACSSSTSSSAASSVAPVATSSVAPAGSEACQETTDAGAVAVSIVDFDYKPKQVTAKVGQVIAFTNAGSAPHTATLDEGACTTTTLSGGKSDGLVFSRTGTYSFHCAIHKQMVGTIVID
jgi:plastocyanin